jgi:hypothetical protein
VLIMSKPTATWEVTAKELAKKAIKDRGLLPKLLQGILSKEDRIRYTNFMALMFVCEDHADLLYPQWDHFESLLDSENTHSKYIGSYLIASLTSVDRDDKFDRIFDRYYGLLDDKSMIPSAHVARNSRKIVKAKPELEPKITDRLLRIDETRHKPHHKELIKAEAIAAFDGYFETAKEKQRIVKFVKKQLGSKSPKTRKGAKEFLDRWLG